jgi:hypothetical protein
MEPVVVYVLFPSLATVSMDIPSNYPLLNTIAFEGPSEITYYES